MKTKAESELRIKSTSAMQKYAWLEPWLKDLICVCRTLTPVRSNEKEYSH
jgi:hypothetical protein